jgi:hypothetical protein
MMYKEVKVGGLLAWKNYNFCGIHPVVVCYLKTDIHITVNHNKVFLVSSMYAACFGWVDHPRALK